MSLPDIELLEANHKFPGQFPIKVIGTNTDTFNKAIVQIFREELRLDEDPEYSVRATKAGRHVSFSFSPTFESAQQVLGVYARINTVDGVVMIL